MTPATPSEKTIEEEDLRSIRVMADTIASGYSSDLLNRIAARLEAYAELRRKVEELREASAMIGSHFKGDKTFEQRFRECTDNAERYQNAIAALCDDASGGKGEPR